MRGKCVALSPCNRLVVAFSLFFTNQITKRIDLQGSLRLAEIYKAASTFN